MQKNLLTLWEVPVEESRLKLALFAAHLPPSVKHLALGDAEVMEELFASFGLAMGAGMLPIAVGWGAADSSFRSPMAVAVIGGLMTSTVLSLQVIPAVFTVVDDFGGCMRRLFGRGGVAQV